MTNTNEQSLAANNVNRARECLLLIVEISSRGASSSDPEVVGYALEELTQVLLERTDVQERYFEPISATEITGLEKLWDELDFVSSGTQSLIASRRQMMESKSVELVNN